MSTVERWLAKEEARRAKVKDEMEVSPVKHEEDALIFKTNALDGTSESKDPDNKPIGSPTLIDSPQAPDMTLGNALAQGVKSAQRNTSKDNLAALKSLQEKFALFSGPVLSIVDIEASKCGQLTLIQLASGKILMQRHLANKFSGVNPGAVINLFLQDPNTTIYKGVDFCPTGGKEGYLNLWVGPTLKPAEGKWDNVKDFLLNIICSGTLAIYVYLILYLAHALQRPQQKPGVMLTLLGGQGIGKGTFMKIIMLIWGATTYKTNRIEDAIGNFNSAVEGKFWLLLDEAQFSGDTKATEALKSFTTESTISINAKFQAQRMIPSLHRIVSATNQMSIGKRDSDDRRDLTLKVSEKHKGNHAYWEQLNNCLEQEVAAMMFDLISMDISLFNVYEKPDTDELTTQKINSLTPEEAWWLNNLRDGALPFGSRGGWAEFVKTKDITDRITQYRNDLGHRRIYLDSSIQVNNLMAKWCKSAVKGRSPDSTRHRGYHLPALEEARQNFEETLGGKVDWEE